MPVGNSESHPRRLGSNIVCDVQKQGGKGTKGGLTQYPNGIWSLVDCTIAHMHHSSLGASRKYCTSW